MEARRDIRVRGLRRVIALLLASALVVPARAQDALAIVRRAVDSEMAANRDDHSHWKYMKHEDDGDLYVEVETQYGAMSRHVEMHGQPATAKQLAEDDAHNWKFAHDPDLQAKQRRDGQHDDKSATELLEQMPGAFLWTVVNDGPETVTLSYKPNPAFSPPDMESRVMSAMAGTMVVNKSGYRIQTFRGRLASDVTIGFGLLARIHQGGTFDVERRQVAPGLWQIVETHVHISGHALFFKTIGQQQDEVKTDFTPIPASTTLEQALEMLKR